MEKNKSIDGLKPRRSKGTAKSTTSKTSTQKTPKTPAKAKTTTKAKSTAKSSTSKPTVKAKDTTPKSPLETSLPDNAPAPAISPTSSPEIAPEPTPEETKTLDTLSANPAIIEDFLKPVQAFDFDEESGELKVAKEKPASISAKEFKKATKKPSKKRKIILGIIIFIALLLVGGATWFVLWGNDIIAKITGGQGNILDLIFVEPTYEPLKTDANGRTNILAFGTSGYNMEGDEGNGIHDGAQLTDSIMAISLDQNTGDIAMVSLPRDLKASPTCTATGKINEVYWCNNMDGNNEQAGAEALMTEVGDILGIDFQYFAHLNWGSLVQIVDTLGGITITLDEDINDYYYTGSVYTAGTPYTITGIEAVALARARHGTTSGDFSRGASQQKILIGIKDKVLEKNFSIADLINLASTLGDNLRSNFSIDEIKTVAHLATDLDLSSIRQVSLIEPENFMTTGTINGISYVLPSAGNGNYGKIRAYIAKMLSSDPRVYEDSTILVLNGTETPGLASSEKSTLEEDGYQNISIDDAPAGEYLEEYTLYDLTNTKPGTKKLLEEKYHTTTKSAEELPAGISQDYDFIIILGSTPTEE